jgi:predicted small lipoprotein YifL
MTKQIVLVLVLLAAAGCGVDGPPEPPAATGPAGGLTVGGDVRLGATGRLR